MYNTSRISSDRVAGRALVGLPHHDTMWDLFLAPDDTLYIGACVEHTAGMSAVLCSYRQDTDTIRYLADIGEVTGEDPESGHAPQGKIHFALCMDRQGLLYGATHCTTAPKGDPIWSPFTMYADPVRCFPGSYLFVHDPKTRETRSLGLLIPHEGVRVMVIDQERELLHITSYPKNHYYLYDLRKRELEDLGRLGNIHQLALFLDDQGHGYTTDSFGRMIRCDTDRRRLESLHSQLPHAPFRNGENNIMLQAVRRPGTHLIYGASYDVDQRLFRYDPRTDEMTDLGMGYGRRDYPTRLASSYYPGGLVFGSDGHLYYAMGENETDSESRGRGHIIRRNPDTGEEEDLGWVEADGLRFSGRSCHAKCDSRGVLYFAQNGAVPPQFFIYRPAGSDAAGDASARGAERSAS